MDKSKLNKNQVSKIFGTGFKYPIKFDSNGKKGLSFWNFYNGLTAKQRIAVIKDKTEKIVQLSSNAISGLITEICKKDQKYLPMIIKSEQERVEFLDSMKTTYKDLFTKKVISKLALNLNPNKKESQIVIPDIDTGKIGEIIMANCSLFTEKNDSKK